MIPSPETDGRLLIALDAQKQTATIRGKVLPFQTKLEQAGQMLIGIADYFSTMPLLGVTDSGFGNKSLWKPVRKVFGKRFHLLSRLHSNRVIKTGTARPTQEVWPPLRDDHRNGCPVATTCLRAARRQEGRVLFCSSL